jgi:hypothetical protein
MEYEGVEWIQLGQGMVLVVGFYEHSNGPLDSL